MARALLADQPILVLDEPTEGLDGPTATALVADLLDTASGRTVLMLTHRDEGLDLVDRRYDLVDGRLRPYRANLGRNAYRRPGNIGAGWGHPAGVMSACRRRRHCWLLPRLRPESIGETSHRKDCAHGRLSAHC